MSAILGSIIRLDVGTLVALEQLTTRIQRNYTP